MKRFVAWLLAGSLVAVLAVSSNAMAQPEPPCVDWSCFSKNLVIALQSDNEGLKCSAMQLVIRHHENLDVSAAVWDVMTVFRNHPNPRMRMLALVTLHHMKHSRAMFILKRNLKFEKDPAIARMNRCVVCEYERDCARSALKENFSVLAR